MNGRILHITPHIKQLIDMALDEDFSTGDATTDFLFEGTETATAELIAKEDMVLCGIPVLKHIVSLYNDWIRIKKTSEDGTFVKKGEQIAVLEGSAVHLLATERTILNFLQHLSGIATKTHNFVSKAGNTRIVDTRKTLPGWRYLQKYAVTVGGGYNHRLDLGGGIMIKDNHIDVLGSITKAVTKAKSNAPHTLKIEVEVRNESEVKEAIDAGAEILLLDNMTADEMRKIAEKYQNSGVIFEASGGINEKNIEQTADTGVDVISIGAITHSVRNTDISMKMKIKK